MSLLDFLRNTGQIFAAGGPGPYKAQQLAQQQLDLQREQAHQASYLSQAQLDLQRQANQRAQTELQAALDKAAEQKKQREGFLNQWNMAVAHHATPDVLRNELASYAIAQGQPGDIVPLLKPATGGASHAQSTFGKIQEDYANGVFGTPGSQQAVDTRDKAMMAAVDPMRLLFGSMLGEGTGGLGIPESPQADPVDSYVGDLLKRLKRAGVLNAPDTTDPVRAALETGAKNKDRSALDQTLSSLGVPEDQKGSIQTSSDLFSALVKSTPDFQDNFGTQLKVFSAMTKAFPALDQTYILENFFKGTDLYNTATKQAGSGFVPPNRGAADLPALQLR